MAEAQHAHAHFWQLTVIVAFVFFTPALQILTGELLLQSETGDRDICYYNDLCERPDFSGGLMMYAFNNVYSNIGYLIAGFTAAGYLLVLRYRLRHFPRYMPNNYSILWAMCICLAAVGFNSGIYHLCPSRTAFQVDSAMMLGFALLSLGDIWRRYWQPRLHSWPLYMILACLLFLNYIGTVLDTYPTLMDKMGPKYWYRGCLTVICVAFIVALLLWIWRFKRTKKGRKSKTVLIFVMSLPVFILLWTTVDADLSQTLLAMFLFLYAVAVVADFCAQIGIGKLIESRRCPRALRCRSSDPSSPSCFHSPRLFLRLRTTALILWLFSGWAVCGLLALYYFSVVADTNKDLSPALSRNLNNACVIADYYSTHDLWHFLSALWLLFQLLINAHLAHGLRNPERITSV